ncbi:MAG: hypothetical protein KDE53_08435, partial [Caldilineaceae bacterium]|nr:hypothetical protein [Caldilineaceae bacterium]
MPSTINQTYLNFDLLITRAGEGYRAYVIDAPGGDAAVSFALPPDMLTGERLVHGGGTRRGARLRNPSPTTPPPDLRTRGRTLFETIFRDEVRSVLVASQSEA